MKTHRPYWILIGLLAVAHLALWQSLTLEISSVAGVRPVLPERVGEWVGTPLRFCQNRECLRQFDATALTDPERCPHCGGRLDDWALAERQLLPRDTVIVRRRYVRTGSPAILVSLVLSGRERASIHRPEICQTGQGNRILDSQTLAIPLQGRPPLRVRVLDLVGTRRTGDGTKTEVPSFFVYWFVGRHRETPSHFERLLWMAQDRVFRNVAHRWAYVSIAVPQRRSPGERLEPVAEFVQGFYPLILEP